MYVYQTLVGEYNFKPATWLQDLGPQAGTPVICRVVNWEDLLEDHPRTDLDTWLGSPLFINHEVRPQPDL